jgi:hypothetical protein
MAKLFIKETEETKKNGSAGKAVFSVAKKETTPTGMVLTVLVQNGKGGLDTVVVRQSETEIR